MNGQVLLQLCFSLALSIHGGALQPVVDQPPQVSSAEGTTAVLQCRVASGKIQDYHVFWFQQKSGDRPAFVLKHHIHGQIERNTAFNERFVSVRDTSANAYVLQIQTAQMDDSATYWCMAEKEMFSTAVSGAGTQLSITGGKSAKAPAVVSLLYDVAAQISDSPTVHALCLAQGFYPGFLEIKWSAAGNAISEGVTPGQVIVDGERSYSSSSILHIPRNLLRDKAPIKCSVHHYSSGATVERSLDQC